MGLSASQTRYLSLTARKSNVEYQGQQINQARTALANQSSELYTEMMTLQAPTAPSPYTYVIDPAAKPVIDWSQPAAWPLTRAQQKDFEIYYAGNEPKFTAFNITEYEKVYNEATKTSSFFEVSYDKDGNRQVSSRPTSEEALKNTTYCYKETGYTSDKEEVSFMNIHTSEDESCSYRYDSVKGVFVEKTDKFTPNDFPSHITAFNAAAAQYNVYSEPIRKDIYESLDVVDNAKTSDNPGSLACGQRSTATKNINQAQYNAAMVQYKADLAEYEEHLDIINKKSEEIHESDKKLELQLKQLDTEQEAIQTEYEAVKKVIEKNIENTFKTFG